MMNLAPQSCIESVSSFAEDNNVELSITGLEMQLAIFLY